jgi:hypothetical protein
MKSNEPARHLLGSLRAYLNQIDSGKIKLGINHHYRKLRLVDKNGQFRIRQLEDVSEFLLPGNLGLIEIDQFLDRMAGCADANPYLRKFLQAAPGERFQVLERKIEDEGSLVIPDAIFYAFALDRLTATLRQDPTIIDSLLQLWEKERQESGMDKHMTAFWKVKRVSVKYPIEKMVKFHESGKIASNFMKFLLPLNILEAAAGDLFLGFPHNAKAAWTLALNRPQKLKQAEDSPATTATWSKDRKAFNYNVPLPRKWADLYSTWNLAFITSFRDFPYAFAKLLIPAVGDYRDAPGEYIYNRTLALFIHIYYSFFHRTDKARQGEEVIDWTDVEFTRFWGRINKASAKEYADERRSRSNV